MDKDFILKMIENISKSYSGIETHKGFSEDLYALASNPDIDLTYLKKRLQDICKSYDIPESTIETINNLNNGINVLIQKESDNKILEDTAKLEVITEQMQQEQAEQQEQIEINRQIEQQQEKEALEEEVEQTEEIVENSEAEISIDNDTNSIEEVSLEMRGNDTVESMANQLIDLKAKGIAAKAMINGMEVYNVFDTLEQFKEGYYNYQTQELMRIYNNIATNRQLGEHTSMAIFTPEGENNKRIVRIGNSNGESFDNQNNITLEFTDGKDFDLYMMPALMKSFTNDCSDIKEIDDENNITRGVSLSNEDRKENPDERYRYFATMTNDNKLMLSMASESIDQAKAYINSSTKVVTEEHNKEANEQIVEANNNGEQLEKAAVKVKKLNPNGFVTGLGMGALIGLSIVGNIIGLYLLKLFG